MSHPAKNPFWSLVVLTALALSVGFLAVAGGPAAAGAAAPAESTEHSTSTTVKCEPTEGAVGTPRICVATVTDTSPNPSAPSGQVAAVGGFSCALVAAGPGSATCSLQATPNAPGTYPVELTFIGGVGFYASSGATKIIAGTGEAAQHVVPVPVSSLVWSGVGVPTIALGTKPAKQTRRPLARFTFSSPESGARFECRIDWNLFKACSSPFQERVGTGSHIFRVRVISAAGTFGEHPIEYRWKVLPKKR